MTLGERKRIELLQKSSALQHELLEWQNRSRAHQQLARHWSQIRRISGQLEKLENLISSELSSLESDADLLARCAEFEIMMLQVHGIWEFFRSKFSLRTIEWLVPYLSAVDELAWHCYLPAQESVPLNSEFKHDLKAPPLVFFTEYEVPFTQLRKQPFELDGIAAHQFRHPSFRVILQELPVPVIALPWLQSRHLPGAILVGHEVGHNVENDFELADTIRGLLKQHTYRSEHDIPASREKAWLDWSSEVFADIYATLALGPSFVMTFIDFLAADKSFIETERVGTYSWGEYPTSFIRVLITLAVLRLAGHVESADQIEAAWRTEYLDHAMPEFEDDVNYVVKAILYGPYPQFEGRSLLQVISFSRVQHSAASIDAERLLANLEPRTDDIRVLFAAIGRAFFLDPVVYIKNEIQSKVIGRASELISSGAVRGRISTKQLQRDDDPESTHRLYGLLYETAAQSNHLTLNPRRRVGGFCSF